MSPAAVVKVAEAASIAAQKEELLATTPVLHLPSSKYDNLVAHDIVLDETQLAALDGLVGQQFACMFGAAGTGKTTTTKALIQRVSHTVGTLDIKGYFGGTDEGPGDSDDWAEMGYDSYEEYREAMDEEQSAADSAGYLVPSICMCAFTGKATQAIKRNFPKSWYPNIMTIHRMLQYKPEFYEDEVWDDSRGGYITKRKRRFVPTRTASNPLPWDIIIIDEASMLDTILWGNIFDAIKPTTRVIMIGDINQLPPVQGRSIFGYAMTRWPVFELTHIHRQKNVDGGETINPIVENAWRILRGEFPKQAPGVIAMQEFKGDTAKDATPFIKMMVQMYQKGLFNPDTDTIITAINGTESKSGLPNGWQMGQEPLNEALVLYFNEGATRHLTDGGMGLRRHFAVGDKVMATKNDYTNGVTNGMTGKVVSMVKNAGYVGTLMHIDDTDLESSKSSNFNDDSILEEIANIDFSKQEEDKALRGPSNYTIEVDFGGETGVVPFSTVGEVGSLQLAYVITCHKSQGAEYRLVVICGHPAHGRMHSREWLYTAWTRASQKILLCSTQFAVKNALRNQRIKGSSTAEKVASFAELVNKGAIPPGNLPEAKEIGV